MNTFVAINCKNKKCFEYKLEEIEKFLPKKSWMHIDVSDRSFSTTNSFFDKKLINKYSKIFNFECHLMMSWEKIVNGKWFDFKCKRFLIHNSQIKNWDVLFKISKKFKKEIGIVIDFDDKVKNINIPKWIKFVEVLAVKPGMSGQGFQKKALKIISFLKKNLTNVKISVDGGIDLKIGKLLKKRGANILISSSYIWDSKNPKEAYKKLSSI